MPIRKVHLVKQDEFVTERGVQLRTDDPSSPVEDQLWVNKSEKKIYLRSGSENIPLSDSSKRINETRTITQVEALYKKLQLEYVPALDSVSIVPEGGPTQHLGNDFQILNNDEVSWAGLGLDGLIEKGDTLYISYIVV